MSVPRGMTRNVDFNPEFKNHEQAFREAIADGRLSEDPLKPNYVDRYMYMGTWNRIDQFKNINTREYLK